MKKVMAAVMGVAFALAMTPMSEAASCPPEVAQAKEMLNKKAAIARGQDVQAPRSLAGARQDAVQAPRGQDVQAPRGQDVQAPRGQDVQAPRGQDVQAPRSLAAAKSSTIKQAQQFVKQAQAACKAGDTKTAKEKAEAAINILR